MNSLDEALTCQNRNDLPARRRVGPAFHLATLILAMSAALLVTGCATETAETVPDATAVPTITNLRPTPTLAPGVPTPPLPTPPITPSPEGNSRQGDRVPAPVDDPAKPTPVIEERLALGEEGLRVEDYDLAAEQFSRALRQEPGLDEEEQADTLYHLGVAYLGEGKMGDAATMFNQLIGLVGDDVPAPAHFHLAQASHALGEYERAIEHYNAYLRRHPEMGAYVYPLIAESYLALGESEPALEAYESAVEAPSHRLQEYATRIILANYYLGAESYVKAIEQYDAIFDFAQAESTRGQMIYLAGAAELLAGNTEAAYARFLQGIDEYPQIYESYLGLVELVKAEIAVDDFQRGLVDYHAAAYAPGIAAFEAHLAANPEEYDPEAYLYLAKSHEALGDTEAALAQLENYEVDEPVKALFERAEMQARAGEIEPAVASYEAFLEAYAETEQAAQEEEQAAQGEQAAAQEKEQTAQEEQAAHVEQSAWQLAVLVEQSDDLDLALQKYEAFAGKFPEHEDAPEALHQAGRLAMALEDEETAFALWQQAAEMYPDSRSGSAALVRLLRDGDRLEADQLDALRELALEGTGTGYYAWRARDIVAEVPPFAATTSFELPGSSAIGQVEAEEWLLALLEVQASDLEDAPGELDGELLDDERLQIGQQLWDLRLFEAAKLELEDLREAKAESLLDSYRLALYFRDLGLYRSSIVAASTVLHLAEQSILEAPLFIGRLAYPVYYAQEILPLAENYGYDPRLQFALVRQESLFESFARSGAAAQGLSQVIPDTGAWIAEELEWPAYENEDLYKPYVGLEFGAFYLAEQLKAFDGDIHAALSAYNAGPGNAARWHEEAGSDLDQFVDTIDFWETRTYVERIYAGFDIYRTLYAP